MDFSAVGPTDSSAGQAPTARVSPIGECRPSSASGGTRELLVPVARRNECSYASVYVECRLPVPVGPTIA
eukprot:scaffold17117_cov52-Attheya_sp.AAC.10